ncbi:hypothetical protein V5T82_05890 [Magnetovibrio sp. PR-2]|uniref:hypothetical protein n=1 Tax=Magnetovibrio sp. PR-2 TaxID=3120356 RepID=UPI002FCE16FC
MSPSHGNTSKGYTSANKIHKDTSPPDLDYGDDILYYKSEEENAAPAWVKRRKKRRQQGKDNDLTMLLMLCLFAFLMLGGFVFVKVTPGVDFNFAALFSMAGVKNDPAYQLGNVRLGTTLDILRKDFPNAYKAMSANGSVTMSFSDDDGDYTVWYGEDGPMHMAYKVRQNYNAQSVSEDELVNTVAKRYGRPSVSECSKRSTDGVRECRYSWWLRGELRLDMVTRLSQREAPGITQVTMMATDTNMETQVRRANLGTNVRKQN